MLAAVGSYTPACREVVRGRACGNGCMRAVRVTRCRAPGAEDPEADILDLIWAGAGGCRAGVQEGWARMWLDCAACLSGDRIDQVGNVCPAHTIKMRAGG